MSRRPIGRSPNKINYIVNDLDKSFNVREVEKTIEKCSQEINDDSGLQISLSQELCKLLKMSVSVAVTEESKEPRSKPDYRAHTI